MALFKETRVGGNYDYTVHPAILEFLKKKTTDSVDEIWEGRHNWTNLPLMDRLNAGTLPPALVDVLDTNAAFLSAFKAHLPIGALQHHPGGGFDPRRSGIYLLNKRPAWEHPHLPDPVGNRREPGPERGAAGAEDIDRGMTLGSGYPMGLLALLDMIGIDTITAVAHSMREGADDLIVEVLPLLIRMAEDSRLGRKSGRGFFRYDRVS